MVGENEPYRVVAVCLGNICRSPIAAAVLEAKLEAAGLAHLTAVESAGTSGWHVGGPADPRAQAALARAGYEISHRARMFEPDWFDRADLILGMDYQNVLDVRALAPSALDVERVRPIRSFDPALTYLPEDDPELEVPDPYYGETADFDEVVRMIEAASTGVIEHVRLNV